MQLCLPAPATMLLPAATMLFSVRCLPLTPAMLPVLRRAVFSSPSEEAEKGKHRQRTSALRSEPLSTHSSFGAASIEAAARDALETVAAKARSMDGQGDAHLSSGGASAWLMRTGASGGGSDGGHQSSPRAGFSAPLEGSGDWPPPPPGYSAAAAAAATCLTGSVVGGGPPGTGTLSLPVSPTRSLGTPSRSRPPLSSSAFSSLASVAAAAASEAAAAAPPFPVIVRMEPVVDSEPVRVFEGHTEDVLDVCWSRGDLLLSASVDG